MPGTVATPTVLSDPGILLWAPVLTALPANTVVGSVFTDTFASGGWVQWGATEAGSTWSYETNVEALVVAEFLDPISYRATGRTGSFEFNLANFTLSNLAKALNGSAPTVVSGSGTTQLNRVRPTALGSEVRCMIGWESLDGTTRIVCYQTLISGAIAPQFQKAPAYATIPVHANFEVTTGGLIFDVYTAGTARA